MKNPAKYSDAELISLTSTANVYRFLQRKHPDSIIDDPDGIRPLNNLNVVIKPTWHGGYATDIHAPLTPLEVLTNIYNYPRRQALEELLPFVTTTEALPAPSCTDNYAAYDYLCGYLGLPKFLVDRLILEGMLWNDDYGDIVLASGGYSYAEVYHPAPRGYSAPIEYTIISQRTDPYAFWFWTPKIYKVRQEYYALLPVYVCESIVEALALALIPGEGFLRAEVYCSVGSGDRTKRSDSTMSILEKAGVNAITTSERLHKAYPDVGYIHPHTGSWLEDLNEIGWIDGN